jgi:uncharacterized protein with NRDE domain
MCLIALGFRASKFPLVIAANRDEDYGRPTLPADFWNDSPDILGGRDALLGGTWLAVTREGRFAAVTNLRGSPRDAKKRSRGELVSEFVRSSISPLDYANGVAARADAYAGFHLIAGDHGEIVMRSGSVRKLEPGVHALSNAPDGELWPKVVTAEAGMRTLMSLDDPGRLLDATLQFLSTPLGIGRVESEVFVAGERYGTRSSTAIVMTKEEVYFAEQSYGRGGTRDGEPRRFRFVIST